MRMDMVPIPLFASGKPERFQWNLVDHFLMESDANFSASDGNWYFVLRC